MIMPQDEAILSAARAGVEALNARHAEGRSDRFYLVHRVRQWNPHISLRRYVGTDGFVQSSWAHIDMTEVEFNSGGALRC